MTDTEVSAECQTAYQAAIRELGGQITIIGCALMFLALPIVIFGGLWHPLYPSAEALSGIGLVLFLIGAVVWNFKWPFSLRRK